MTASISKPFILRPIATSLFMFAILLAGIFAYQYLPVSALPEVDYPTIQVTTFYPGASPDVIASSITSPLERQFGQMPGLNQMTSTSSEGSSLVTLQFDLQLSLDVAEQEVQAAMNAAASFLPTDLPNPPIYSKVNPADVPIMTLALTSKTLPLAQVEDLADTRLAPKISQLSGVGLVSINGGQRPAVRVQMNPNTLAAYKLNFEDIRTAINNANVNAAKGNFDGERLSYTINSNDQLLTSKEYLPLIVSYKNNAPVRLSDLGNVVDGVENVKQAAWMNMEPAIILNIQRQPGANVIAVADSIKKLLPQLKAGLPSTINVSILTDRTISIRHSISDAQFELLFSIALVVLVIFLFLNNLPATFIPSIAVPLSLIGTFAVIYQLGFSINNLTLMALIIATGFVVDDAIVMIENISRYIEQGEKPIDAALKGAAQISFTILSLTISLIAVLIPLLFMGDIVGRLFREFSITLAITILISGIVSLTLTPMLCARMLRHHTVQELSRFERYAHQTIEKIIARYATSLRFVLNHQRATLYFFAGTLVITGVLFYTIPKGFFPIQDTGVIQGISEAPQSISFPAMAVQQQKLAKVILEDPAVDNISSFIGVDGTNTTLNSGRILITLKPLEERNIGAVDVINRLQSKLNEVPGITLFMQPVQDLTMDDRVSRTQYQYSLSSPNADEVSTWTDALLEKLRGHHEFKDLASDQQNQGLAANLVIDRNTAMRFGITPAMIDNTLADAFGQRQVSTLFTQTNQYHVILEAASPLKLYPQNVLDHLFIQSTSGTTVPFSAFTTISPSVKPLAINRQGQFPVATLSFNLGSKSALGDAVNAIDRVKEELHIPVSVQTSFEGAARIFQNALSHEAFLVFAAILVVYIVLGILYESYIHPITILSTLPSAGLGALLALSVSGLNLNVMALIGIILLIGIVKKNGIMMVDFAIELERKENKSPHDAIYEACLLRFRPILMTTMAALLGAIPLAFAGGIGAELRRPLGITIIGGLILSQLLTLYTTPVIYLAFDKILHFIRKLSSRGLTAGSSDIRLDPVVKPRDDKI